MKREFSDFIKNASNDERRIIYDRAMLKVIEYQQEIISSAVELSDRREHLCKNAPSCPECSSKQVQLLDISFPAEWKCRDCSQYFPFEPPATQNEK